MTRRVLMFCAAAALLVVVGLAGARWLSGSATPVAKPLPATMPATPASAPATSGDRVELVDTSGVVERRAANGPWTRARVGDVLEQREAIRTGAEARAELRVGPEARLTVERSTEVSVVELTEVVHRFKLEQGRLGVSYRAAGKRQVQVETDLEGNVAARTGQGTFSVLRTPTAVAVATRTGVVDLSTPRGTTRVKEGQQSVVLSGEPPAPAVALPKEVLLQLAKLEERPRPGDRETTVRGQTQAGNRVFIAGRVVPVDRHGRFSASVPVRAGHDQIEILTEGPSGDQRTQVIKLALAATRPAGGEKRDKLDVHWHKRPKIDLKWGKQP